MTTPCPTCTHDPDPIATDLCHEHMAAWVATAERPTRILGAGSTVAVGRFRPEGVEGYRSRSNPAAPLRATRTEAEGDEHAWLDRLATTKPTTEETRSA